MSKLINDLQGRTLVTASSLDAEIAGGSTGKTKTAKAGMVGTLLAKRAQEKGIKQVTFDRNGCKYHGRIKALAEAAREGGLKF
jgi:large subunit ribosomal protein L18